jgi:RNA polymerase sigma-70 factor, ECF subfamily
LSSSTARLNDLIDAVAEGDRPALEELYRLTCAKLYGVALRILRRPELAEEALRAAYLRIWQEAGTYDPRLSDPMIFTVAAVRNAALALARKRGENGLHAVAAPEATSEEPDAPPPMSDPLKRLLAALAGLSEDLRRMVLLAYYDGFSRHALAVEFDAPASTVATWIRRSLGQIRDGIGR